MNGGNGPINTPGLPAFMRGLPEPKAGAPTGGQGVVSLPAGNVVPVLGDSEVGQLVLQFPHGSNTMPSPELPVFSTKRQWTSIDVYVNPQATAQSVAANQLLTIWIYARILDVRVLVASGRLAFSGTAANLVQWTTPIYMAAARMAATSFEVTASWVIPGPQTPTDGKVNVTCVASNTPNEPPPNVGMIFGTLPFLGATALNSPRPFRPEICAVTCDAISNNPGVPTWLHIHDVSAPTTGLAQNGRVPTICYALQTLATGGLGLVDRLIRWRPRGFALFMLSSTAATSTNVAMVSTDVSGAWR